MADPPDMFTLGVEEEFFLIDPETRQLSPAVSDVLPRAKEVAGDQVDHELQRAQIETGTEVCRTLEELRAELARLRCGVAKSAESVGKAIGASGTHPFADWRSTGVTPEAAYLKLERDYQQIAREQIVCGCHIHVGMPDREQAIQVLNRVRPWLSPILALSVNSPFWEGVDTGYDSYRTEVWRRWPMSGTAHLFRSRAEYEELVRTLMSTGSIDDPARIYWDVRLSAKFDTLEFRVTDVCMTIDEAVMIAALVRGLARTCHRQMLDGVPAPDPRPELLRAATWRAARYGVQADLIDIGRRVSVPALEMVRNLLDLLEPALAGHGESEEVASLVGRTLSRGTGASRQRRAFSQRERMEDVVDLVIAETVCVC